MNFMFYMSEAERRAAETSTRSNHWQSLILLISKSNCRVLCFTNCLAIMNFIIDYTSFRSFPKFIISIYYIVFYLFLFLPGNKTTWKSHRIWNYLYKSLNDNNYLKFIMIEVWFRLWSMFNAKDTFQKKLRTKKNSAEQG